MMTPKTLRKAAEDFRYLLNRGYPRKASLDLVGNRHGLAFDERHLLHRGIFADRDAKRRKAGRIAFYRIRNKDLAIDGHNVIITLEAALAGLPLILGDDGFVRDISGLSGSYKPSERTEEVLSWIVDGLKRVKPVHTLILLDAPMSRSGELAREIRNRFIEEGIPGDARAVRVPEKVLIGFPGIVATSDTAIIDRSKKAVDFAGAILRRRMKPGSILRLLRK
jgi:hypothetical protein